MPETTLNPADLKKLKVPDLKRELSNRGLPVKGTKPDLIQRLTEYLQKEAAAAASAAAAATSTAAAAVEKDLLEDDEDAKLESDGSAVVAVAAKPTVPVVATETKASNENKLTVATGEDKVVKIVGNPSVKEDVPRKIARAKKFNVPLSSADKKAERAERFGTAEPAVATVSKLDERAKRFNIKTPELSGDSRLKQRQKRFGIVTTPLSVDHNPYKVDNRERVRRRKERFGAVSSGAINTETDAKKRKRAERFGL
ncbi:SAP domain-containing ribonucleoprotein-like [Oscarella lobularis]|uniref:SAP domain-containing ribonucleoprotein-like n=1 Tax=Oscarella lobularis TaxID=121494 RepID=UPI00331392A8